MDATNANTCKLLGKPPHKYSWPKVATSDMFLGKRTFRFKVGKQALLIKEDTDPKEIADEMSKAGFNSAQINSIIQTYRQITS